MSRTRQKVTAYTNCIFVFERLGVEVVNFYNFRYKIFSECSVLLSPVYVILSDFCSGVSGRGKLNR